MQSTKAVRPYYYSRDGKASLVHSHRHHFLLLLGAKIPFFNSFI